MDFHGVVLMTRRKHREERVVADRLGFYMYRVGVVGETVTFSWRDDC